MAALTTPFDLDTFKNLLHGWVSGSTGITTVWKKQNAPQPAYPFCTLILTGPYPYTWDWEEKQRDFDEPNDRVVMDHVVPCRFILEVQARTSDTSATHSIEYLMRAQAGLNHSDYADAFHTADIGILDKGNVRNLETVLPDAIMAWSILEVTLGARLSSREYLDYIENVHVTSEDLGVDQVLGVDGDL